MKKLFLPAAALSLLGGCASNPWPHYESAIRCHLDKKGEECNPSYEKAIEIDPKLQGVHASYGVHLLQSGRTADAEKQFTLERANYPQFAEKGIAALSMKRAPEAASTTASPAAKLPAVTVNDTTRH